MRKISTFYIPLVMLLFTCTKEQVTSRTYPRVLTGSVGAITTDGVLFTGEITFSSTDITDHGFLWGLDFPEMGKSEKISLGAAKSAGAFEAMVDRNMQAGKTYLMRAYAQSASNLVYGQTQTFVSQGCKNTPIITDFAPKQGTTGDTIVVQGNYFSGINSSNEISLGDMKVSQVSSSPTEIVGVIPSTFVVGSVGVSVVSGGIQVSATNNFIFKEPKIDAVQPQNAVIGKTLIEITGTALGTSPVGLIVRFGATECPVINMAPSKIVVKLPHDTPVGKFPITIEKNGIAYASSVSVLSVSPWTKETINSAIVDNLGNPVFVIDDNVYFKLSNKQMWRYNLTTKTWNRLADAPFSDGGVTFSINGKAYVAAQFLYAYDPLKDQWTSFSLPSLNINGAAATTANGLGYTFRGNGTGGVRTYNPVTNSWNSLTSVITNSEGFNNPIGFKIGDAMYLGLSNNEHLWRYDITANSWRQLRDFPGTARSQAISFAVAGSGFVGAGLSQSYQFVNEFWEYDSTLDAWVQRADMPSAIHHVNTFSYLTKGYVTSNSGNGLELWSYDPDR